jgi:signal transduction histidine kinase
LLARIWHEFRTLLHGLLGVHALLEPAVKFSATGETVRLSSDVLPDSHNPGSHNPGSHNPGSPQVVIETGSEMIGVALRPKFFDIYAVRDSTAPGGESGLGTPMAHRILCLFGASVAVAHGDPSGYTTDDRSIQEHSGAGGMDIANENCGTAFKGMDDP